GRRLAYVMTETGEFVNATLVREGLARVSARTPLARLTELKQAEREAQSQRRGMWGAAPRVPASGYTRRSAARRSGARTPTREHSGRVRVRAQDPRTQQALLPLQPLADLDLRVLHRAGAAYLRSLRARVRRAHGDLAGRRAR